MYHFTQKSAASTGFLPDQNGGDFGHDNFIIITSSYRVKYMNLDIILYIVCVVLLMVRQHCCR